MTPWTWFASSRSVFGRAFGVILLVLMPLSGWAEPPQGDASANTSVPTELERLNFYEPAGKPFALWIPEEWQQTLYDFLTAHESWELKIWPGGDGLAYVLIEVNYYANRHKSPERYIRDRTRGPVQNFNFKGYPAQTFEVTTDRTPPLGMEGELPVPVFKQYIVVPLDSGYVTLVYDVPRSLAELFRPYFDDVVSAFTLPARDMKVISKDVDVTSEEYAVYSDFLTASRSDLPFDDASQPGDVLSARLVSGETIRKGAPQGDTLRTLQKTLGPLDEALIRHYAHRNQTPLLIKDKLDVPDLEIDAGKGGDIDPDPDTDTDPDTSAGNAEIAQVPSNRSTLHLLSGRISFSRVGFAADGKTALFYVSHSGGGPSTGHYVVMDKRDYHWAIRGAMRVEYLIH